MEHIWWALATLVNPKTYVDRTVDFDLQDRFDRHKLDARQQLSAPLPSADVLRRELKAANLEQIGILRRSLLGSVGIVVAASAAGVIVRHTVWTNGLAPDQGARTGLAIASAALFVIATLGRVGWPRRSYEDFTSMGRLDVFIYRCLYGAGMFCGTLAVLT